MKKMCRNDDPTAACGWYAGTVRASFGFIIITSIVGLSGAMMILLFIRGQYEAALGIMNGLSGILGTVIGYYFASRSAATANEAITKIEHENNEIKNRKLDIQLQAIQMDHGDENIPRGLGRFNVPPGYSLVRNGSENEPREDVRINMDEDMESVEIINSS